LSCPNTALYAGWYQYGHYNDAFTWNDGAIGFHLDSGSILPRPSGVFRDLLAGANVGDAFLRNTRFLKWMIVNVGDPLTRTSRVAAWAIGGAVDLPR
jgi:hypothetical protein